MCTLIAVQGQNPSVAPTALQQKAMVANALKQNAARGRPGAAAPTAAQIAAAKQAAFRQAAEVNGPQGTDSRSSSEKRGVIPPRKPVQGQVRLQISGMAQGQATALTQVVPKAQLQSAVQGQSNPPMTAQQHALLQQRLQQKMLRQQAAAKLSKQGGQPLSIVDTAQKLVQEEQQKTLEALMTNPPSAGSTAEATTGKTEAVPVSRQGSKTENTVAKVENTMGKVENVPVPKQPQRIDQTVRMACLQAHNLLIKTREWASKMDEVSLHRLSCHIA